MSAVEHMLILWNIQATSSLGKKYFCNGVDLSNIIFWQAIKIWYIDTVHFTPTLDVLFYLSCLGLFH